MNPLFDARTLVTGEDAAEFLVNVLQASTEYSIVGTDMQGTILLWNEGARRLYGYAAEDVVGKANASLLHADSTFSAERTVEAFAASLKTGKWEATLQRQRKNGEHFPARVVITPRRNAIGEAIGFVLISKDVSDEVRLADELKATQLYTRSLIESNIDALMTTDPLGIISDVNKQMEDLTGLSRDALIGSPFKNYFTDAARAEAGIEQVLREGKVNNYELTALAADGRQTAVSYNASTFYDAENRVQGVFAAARDITEQQALEDQLRDSQAYNRGLIEASVDGLITVDPAGTISDVNASLCRMAGYSRQELIGTPFANYFVDAEQADAGVKQTFDQGKVTDYVLTLATRDRRHVNVSFNASVFRDQAGAVSGIFASARDITEQARLQAQLAEERAYNRGLIEASADGLITVDPALNITDVNQSMCRLAGYSRQQLIGTAFSAYFTDPQHAARGVKLTLDQGTVTNYELTLRSSDRRECLVSFNAAVFSDELGAVRGIFASARDITERKRIEWALQQSNLEMASANLAKDRFLANMSHELRTPLNAIIGFTGTLLMRLPGPLTVDQDKQLKTVRSSARHLLSLINDVLDVAKIEAGKVELTIEPVLCQAVVNEVLETLTTLGAQKGLSCKTDTPADPITLNTDRRALNQILLNLANNAIKFTDDGEITIRLSQKTQDAQTITRFDVTDTGAGIRPEDRTRLFQAFAQLDSASTRRYEGTGLGLYLSQRLAGLIHGRLSFESDFGKGSTFTLELLSDQHPWIATPLPDFPRGD